MSTLPDGFVLARWIGPFNGEAVLHDGTTIAVVSGETVVPVPEGEAKASAYWEPAKAPASKSNSKE